MSTQYLEVEEAAERRQRAVLGEQEDQEGSRDPEKSVSGPPVPTLCTAGSTPDPCTLFEW